MRLDAASQQARSSVSASAGGGGGAGSWPGPAAPRVPGSADGRRRPKAILMKASLTSVVFELVRSDPWEPVMRAGMEGLAASLSSNEGGVSKRKEKKGEGALCSLPLLCGLSHSRPALACAGEAECSGSVLVVFW